jgi:hypothetical protein
VVNRPTSNYTGREDRGLPDGRFSMPKALCIVGMVVGVLLLLVFGLDLGLQFPFRRASMTMDIGGVISAVILGYVSWTTLREQK